MPAAKRSARLRSRPGTRVTSPGADHHTNAAKLKAPAEVSTGAARSRVLQVPINATAAFRKNRAR
jgi:hypothetical protein